MRPLIAPWRAHLLSALALLSLAACAGEATDGGTAFTFVLLETGPEATNLSPEQIAEAAAGHRANIEHLAGEGILLLAGPFGAPKVDARWRGIFIFDEADPEAARAHTASDPAVEMGAFAMRSFPWRTHADLRRVRALEQERKANDEPFSGRAYVLGLGSPAVAASAALAPLEARGLVPMSGTLGGDLADHELFVLAVESVEDAQGMLAGDAVTWQLSAWFATSQLMTLADQADGS